MLSLLHIENIAVIEQIDIVFGAGLNLLTGETGAGKSIVIDALGAVIGLRTSKELVRTGAQSARVSAVFDDLPDSVYAFLRENGFEMSAEELLIQRDIAADGRNVCRIGGQPTTVALLKRLGERLLQIHGQHDSQALLLEETHGPLLDRFAGLDGMLTEYQAAFAQWKRCVGRRDRLQMDEAEKARRMDNLRFACHEIDQAELEVGEDDDLMARRQVLQNAERLREAVDAAYALLLGDDESDGARAQLSQAGQSLVGAAALHGDLSNLYERILELSYAADDIVSELDGVREDLETSPNELDELESRLDLIYRLKRKYGQSVNDILAYGETCRQELETLTNAEHELLRLEAECASALESAMICGQALSAKRRAAAEDMSSAVREELSGLDMNSVSFQVDIQTGMGENDLRADGLDRIRFLLSANKGETLKPLSKIASGGELSRIILALKNVLAAGDEVGTMVFDEIDTGVSGRAAGRVAEKLGLLSRTRQVLCVTHLPQMAAMADSHFRIAKEVIGDRTVTSVDCLDYAGRVDELARVIGGLTITEITRSSAAELLKAADAFKKGIMKA